MNEQGDETLVTGSPVSGGGPRKGQVLGERYEIKERIGVDPFTIDYRALDQETEAQVLVRVVDPQRLPASEAQNAARRLSRVVGIGGKHLSPLLDADVDGGLLFVVERFITGTTLRDVMRARAVRYDILSPKEILPVVARLAAALEAIPPPFRHGDVRAERIVIDTDALLLTSPFLVAALPTETVVSVLREDPRLARMLAPEVASGSAGDAADRYGVGCIVFEALTGRLPERGAPSASELGDIGEVLQAMLSPDPIARPPMLTPLIEVLAERAELPVPEIEPGAFKSPRRLSVRRKGEQTVPPVSDTLELPSDDTEPRPPAIERPSTKRETVEIARGMRDTVEMTHIPEFEERKRHDTRRVVAAQPPQPRKIDGAAPEGTQEIAFDQILEVEVDTEGLAPSPQKDASDPGLDPRLVRAALGVESAEEPRVVPPEPAAPLVLPTPTARRSHNPTLELTADDLEMVEQQVKKLPSIKEPVQKRAAPARRRRPERIPTPVELPTDIKPIPKPRVDSVPPPGSPSLFDDSGRPSAPSVAASAPSAIAPSAGPYLPKPSRRSREGFDTWHMEPEDHVQPTAAPRSASRWIILIAAILGLVIIAAGWFIAQQRRDNIERERRLQERFEQLRESE